MQYKIIKNKKKIKELLSSAHFKCLDMKNSEIYDCDELADHLVMSGVETIDSWGSEYEIEQIFDDGRIQLVQYTYDREFANGIKWREHIMKITGYFGIINDREEIFIPLSWRELSRT